MISVIVTYNDKNMLGRILLPSLSRQTAEYKLIAIDNTLGKFKSASEALNYGAIEASGRYLMFVHQDIELGCDTWLEDTEKELDKIPDLGIAGPIGVDSNGELRGLVCNAGMDMGEQIDSPTEVQTLDECLMIVPKRSFWGLDRLAFDGWHCYGADYCLSIQEKGLKAYAIPAYVYHRSLIINTRDLWKYQKRLYWKHRKSFSHIYTTAGTMSSLRYFLSSPLISLFKWYYHNRKGWQRIVAKELEDCNTILDVGCGYNSPIQCCREDGREHTITGVDIYPPYLEESRKKAIHDSYIMADIKTLQFTDNSFDAVFCSEVIEHLGKIEGFDLIMKMSEWAKKKVIITTPNGFVSQSGLDNPYQEHKSGWSPAELRSLGFNLRGMGGLKYLRDGGSAEIRYRPLYA